MKVFYNGEDFTVRSNGRVRGHLDAAEVLGLVATYGGRKVKYYVPGERPAILATGDFEFFVSELMDKPDDKEQPEVKLSADGGYYMEWEGGRY